MRVQACRTYDSEMRNVIASLLFSAMCAGAMTPPALAFDEDECSQMVRACLSRASESRDVCFESASVSPACIGSEVGELSAKRSHFAPMLPPEEQGPAFLGPEIVDRGCLENFDRQLEITLGMGPLTSELRDSLSSQLDRCNQVAPSDLYRP